jgi:CHAD domain-containing protein
MPLDSKKLEKSFVKLRKLVRKMSKHPTQDEVHDIRTNIRRVEATLQALQINRSRHGRRVLRAITPMRQKAGAAQMAKVRETDPAFVLHHTASQP